MACCSNLPMNKLAYEGAIRVPIAVPCSDQCAVYNLYSTISTDPGLLKIRHSHRFVAVVIQFLIPLGVL